MAHLSAQGYLKQLQPNRNRRVSQAQHYLHQLGPMPPPPLPTHRSSGINYFIFFHFTHFPPRGRRPGHEY